jgi:hypothetical protein
MRYLQNGEEEKQQLTQQFDEWFDNMSENAGSQTVHAALIESSSVSTKALNQNQVEILVKDNNATNELGLMARKIHYTSQDVALINQVEYYVKLLYWLAFLTWGMCILYERRFTMKTGGLFVLFTLFILLQNRIMDSISFIIPADVLVKW